MANALLIALKRAIVPNAKALHSVSEGGGWYPLIRESFSGAWQKNVNINTDAVMSFHADFACKTLIASDIAKLRVKYVEQDSKGIWSETTNSAYSPVLRRPNPYQNRIQFWEHWILSKLARGNTYVLKQRDSRNVVTSLYVLDPLRTRPMVADDGSVFYQLSFNYNGLNGVEDTILVPAREIIHDRMNCLFHPLVGVAPIFGGGRAAQHGINIQNQSIRLFDNNSNPGGILTAPGEIKKTTADRLKDDWEQNFSGKNVGRVAVLGDGLKFEKLSLTAVEGQLIEQLKLTAEIVCSTYHVPPYKIGVGPLPPYGNVQAVNVEYYSECLQSLIEAAELCLDEGLEMKQGAGTEFDVNNLLRMDSVTQMAVLKEGVGAGVFSPNEAREQIELGPVEGGDSPYLQQQNFSLSALARRDASDDPFALAPKRDQNTPSPSQQVSAEDAVASGVPASNDNSKEALAATRTLAGWIARDLFAQRAA